MKTLEEQYVFLLYREVDFVVAPDLELNFKLFEDKSPEAMKLANDFIVEEGIVLMLKTTPSGTFHVDPYLYQGQYFTKQERLNQLKREIMGDLYETN